MAAAVRLRVVNDLNDSIMYWEAILWKHHASFSSIVKPLPDPYKASGRPRES